MTGPCQHCGKPTERWGVWDGYNEATDTATSGTFFDCGCRNPKRTHFGNALRARRLALSVSLRDLADAVSATPARLSGIERGSELCDMELACKLADELEADGDAWIAMVELGAVEEG